MCREPPRAAGTWRPGRFALQFHTIGEMNPLQGGSVRREGVCAALGLLWTARKGGLRRTLPVRALDTVRLVLEGFTARQHYATPLGRPPVLRLGVRWAGE
jgi:hypothetical protein